ncbi:VOC family protein [Paludisphaera sp.]|uniref:VOC family protein n=1 Tax=Paludisphaera sp. TaxID=2017432 RepID=UPI00301BE523
MGIDFTGAFAAIGAEDFARAVAFYGALFGREPDERIRDSYAAFHLPALRLAIFRPRAGGADDFRNPSDRRTALNLVLEVPDLGRAVAEIERLGGTVAPPFDAPHGREAYAYDPDGNRLILVERVGG